MQDSKEISRRAILKSAIVAGAAAAPCLSAEAVAQEKVAVGTVKTPVIGSKRVEPGKFTGSCAKVYFSPVISSEMLIKLYNLVNEGIYGKVAIKLHTGEKHGPNIIPRASQCG